MGFMLGEVLEPFRSLVESGIKPPPRFGSREKIPGLVNFNFTFSIFHPGAASTAKAKYDREWNCNFLHFNLNI